VLLSAAVECSESALSLADHLLGSAGVRILGFLPAVWAIAGVAVVEAPCESPGLGGSFLTASTAPTGSLRQSPWEAAAGGPRSRPQADSYSPGAARARRMGGCGREHRDAEQAQ
jgi:hypothetical protein